MHNDMNSGVAKPSKVDLLNGKALVHRTKTVPENNASFAQGRLIKTTYWLVRIPDRHLLEWNSHRFSSGPAKVLVREKEHSLSALKRPPQHSRCV
jgi:hypothetical protein